MASSGRSRMGIETTGVIIPRTTSANVGWAPAISIPIQVMTPRMTYA